MASRWNLDSLVATTGTIGEGLNLQGLCHRAIYYSNSENSIARWQSEDRIHRIGIHKACTYTDIIAKGSRDAHILANLKKKKDLSQYVLGDIKSQLEEIMNEY